MWRLVARYLVGDLPENLFDVLVQLTHACLARVRLNQRVQRRVIDRDLTLVLVIAHTCAHVSECACGRSPVVREGRRGGGVTGCRSETFMIWGTRYFLAMFIFSSRM